MKCDEKVGSFGFVFWCLSSSDQTSQKIKKILQTGIDLLCPRGSRKSITRERIYLCYSMGKKNQNRAEPHVWKPYKYARGKLPLLGISPIGIDIATLPPPLLFKTTEMQEQK